MSNNDRKIKNYLLDKRTEKFKVMKENEKVKKNVFKSKKNKDGRTIMFQYDYNKYVRLNRKQYARLNSIEAVIMKWSLRTYDECDDEWRTEFKESLETTDMKTVLRRIYEVEYQIRVMNRTIAALYNMLYEIKFKNVIVILKDGKKLKMSYAQFLRKFIPPIVV